MGRLRSLTLCSRREKQSRNDRQRQNPRAGGWTFPAMCLGGDHGVFQLDAIRVFLDSGISLKSREIYGLLTCRNFFSAGAPCGKMPFLHRVAFMYFSGSSGMLLPM
jgi:hypothetical protein